MFSFLFSPSSIVPFQNYVILNKKDPVCSPSETGHRYHMKNFYTLGFIRYTKGGSYLAESEYLIRGIFAFIVICWAIMILGIYFTESPI